MAKLIRLLLVLIFLLIPKLASAQISCQNILFANLPTTPFAQEACSITNDTGCVVGAIAAGGGAVSCSVFWNGTNWINFSNIPGGSSSNVPALQYTVNNLGSTTTPAFNFNLGYIQTFSTTANATATASNIPGSPTNPVRVEIDAYSSTANNILVLPSTFFGLALTGVIQNVSSSPSVNIFQGSGGVSVYTTIFATCDGTNCYIISPGLNTALGALVANNLIINGDNKVTSATRESFPSFIDATAATTTIPYGCNLITKAVTFENVQFTVTSITQSVAPSLSLCDTGTAANPTACGTTIVNSGTFTAAGNISQTTMTTPNVAAGHFVCTFFAAGTATVVIAQTTGTARPQ